jgi:hypothetical protein
MTGKTSGTAAIQGNRIWIFRTIENGSSPALREMEGPGACRPSKPYDRAGGATLTRLAYARRLVASAFNAPISLS